MNTDKQDSKNHLLIKTELQKIKNKNWVPFWDANYPIAKIKHEWRLP